ncbi:hypothetical protein AB0G35_12055 [Streptomyces sp. NPDC021749]|uniref:hypothetical protein n=1 Tax=Streptomyces sp. NPDC021749 TaxID=3154905 RepID=UPI0033E52B4D
MTSSARLGSTWRVASEPLARHATKPEAAEVGEREVRTWFRERDLLPGGLETVIDADSTLEQRVDRIMRETGLAGLPPRETDRTHPPPGA